MEGQAVQALNRRLEHTRKVGHTATYIHTQGNATSGRQTRRHKNQQTADRHNTHIAHMTVSTSTSAVSQYNTQQRLRIVSRSCRTHKLTVRKHGQDNVFKNAQFKVCSKSLRSSLCDVRPATRFACACLFLRSSSRIRSRSIGGAAATGICG